MTNTEKGKVGETIVYNRMKAHGIEAEWSLSHTPWDFKLSDGRTVDVKFSTPTKTGNGYTWMFNLHHHGKKQGIDFFVCVAHGAEEEEDKVFVIPRDLIRSYQWRITSKHMNRGAYDYFDNNFDLMK